MLPLFTTTQVKDGIDTGDLMLDLSDYMKKKDASKLATKEALEALSTIVAGKLDATPQHNHHIEDIKQLQSELNSKYDKGEKYPHNVILSDSEKISYLEAPKIEVMEIAKDKDSAGYKFYVDDSNGDLMIVLDDVLIGMYSRASSKWSFEADLTEINSKIAAQQEVLGNHYEALSAVCNATLINISDISSNTNAIETASNRITSQQEVLDNHYDALSAVCNATLRNISDINILDSKVDNHTHTTFNNDVTISGKLNGYNIASGTTGVDNFLTYPLIPIIKSDGVMEIGEYIDFHLPNNLSQDYAVRMRAMNGGLKLSGELYLNNNVGVLAKINELENILKNHYDALLVLCQKHGMVDSNTSDGSNITPK